MSIFNILEYPVLPIKEITKGEESRTIKYNEEIYTPCGIAVTLNEQDLIAGVTYAVTIEAYNQNGNFYLSTSQEVQIQVISIPVPGTIEVSFTDK